jgi:hypothetical protein
VPLVVDLDPFTPMPGSGLPASLAGSHSNRVKAHYGGEGPADLKQVVEALQILDLIFEAVFQRNDVRRNVFTEEINLSPVERIHQSGCFSFDVFARQHAHLGHALPGHASGVKDPDVVQHEIL